MSRWLALRRVILPRAIRISLPTFSGETILLLKATALASTVAVAEVLGMVQKIRADTLRNYEPLLAAAVVYIMLTFILTRCFNFYGAEDEQGPSGAEDLDNGWRRREAGKRSRTRRLHRRPVERGQCFLLLLIGHERRGEAVAGDGAHFAVGEFECLLDRAVILADIAAEISGVVGIHGDEQALVQHALERMLPQVAHALEAEVRERADRQRHAVARQALHQGLILHRAVAMVDAVDAQDIQRFPDILRRTFLAGMGDKAEAFLAGAAEHILELAGREADL